MTTILGEKINLIRPKAWKNPITYKSDTSHPRRLARTKTIKNHCGRVIAVCVRLKNGAVRAMSPPCTHLDVCEKMVEDADNVTAVGWQLENGEFLWR